MKLLLLIIITLISFLGFDGTFKKVLIQRKNLQNQNHIKGRIRKLTFRLYLWYILKTYDQSTNSNWYFFFTFYRGIIVNSDLDPFSSSLSFHDLKTKHSGNYTCVASNSVAQDSQFSNLVVNGKYIVYVLAFSNAKSVYEHCIMYVSSTKFYIVS